MGFQAAVMSTYINHITGFGSCLIIHGYADTPVQANSRFTIDVILNDT